VIWLASSLHGKLTGKARGAIETSTLYVSPMVGLEIQYLHEIGQVRLGAMDILEKLRGEIGLDVGERSFSAVASVPLGESWTRVRPDDRRAREVQWGVAADYIG
jgi:hypothetical protein